MYFKYLLDILEVTTNKITISLQKSSNAKYRSDYERFNCGCVCSKVEFRQEFVPTELKFDIRSSKAEVGSFFGSAGNQAGQIDKLIHEISTTIPCSTGQLYHSLYRAFDL